MQKTIIYTTGTCPYCDKAKALLKKAGIPYEEIRVDLNPALLTEMIERSGRKTVPQIFIGDRHIGGSDDLHAVAQAEGLEQFVK
jgi:glutaredoxin 3